MADHLECPGDDWCPKHDLWHPGDEPCPECDADEWGGDLDDDYQWHPDDVVCLGPAEPPASWLHDGPETWDDDDDSLPHPMFSAAEIAAWEARKEAEAAEEAAWERGPMVPMAWLWNRGAN